MSASAAAMRLGEYDPLPPNDSLEWSLQFDMRERGRRLTELAKATEGKELQQVRPGVWRYERVRTG